MPMAATSHTAAAVVRPEILLPSRKIAPAPKKPTPDTICAAIRPGSPPISAMYKDNMVNRAAPKQIMELVA